MSSTPTRSLCIAASLQSQAADEAVNGSQGWRSYRPLRSLCEKRKEMSLLETSDWTNGEVATLLYLAYGSNLCDATFLGNRGIRPLSATNVLVPELRLTFDLPGLPYIEPCFANTARRQTRAGARLDIDASSRERLGQYDGRYNKDRWHKGLVGTVYEVTREDYATIIKTEGGGSSYHDILVDCYALDIDDEKDVPAAPSGVPFRAHTLFAQDEPDEAVKRPRRPDPAYAQASARYLGLITQGAEERRLPREYRVYLNSLQPYTVTSRRQALGKAFFLALWVPIIMLFMRLGRMFANEQGRFPRWLQLMGDILFTVMWRLYDSVYRPLFGDGERTTNDSEGLRRTLGESAELEGFGLMSGSDE